MFSTAAWSRICYKFECQAPKRQDAIKKIMMKQIQNSIHIDNWNASSKQTCKDPCDDGIEDLLMNELSNNDIDTMTLHAELKTMKLQFHAVARADKIRYKRFQ